MTNKTIDTLNPNAKLWVEALCSGEYQQGTGTLQTGDSYCCLGVACVVYEKATGKSANRSEEGGNRLAGGTLSFQTNVKNWIGLESEYGKIVLGYSLIDLNDEENLSFEEIAEKIIEHQDSLFSK